LSRLHAAVRRIAADLSRLRKRHAVVGALAVSARVEPRFTRDADFAVAVSGDEEAEAILRDLTAAGYRVDALVEQEEMQRLATTRLVLGDEEEERVVLDLLFASCGIEPEIVDAAEPLAVFADVVLPVARTGHLIAMKLSLATRSGGHKMRWTFGRSCARLTRMRSNARARASG
jgi:sugar/nucleoside kinase (ribokinase family)